MKLRVSLKFGMAQMVHVGDLSEKDYDTVFEFAPSFIGKGLNPAPFRLPVKTGINLYDRSGGMETFGMFEDSLPDGWGRPYFNCSFRKIDVLNKQTNILESHITRIFKKYF